MRLRLQAAVSLGLLSAVVPAAAQTPQSRPTTTLVAGSDTEVLLPVPKITGSGPLRAEVNVGRILGQREQAGRLVLRYRPPAAAYPQRLCLLLWREERAGERSPPRVLRAPIFARITLTVKTRPRSTVTLELGGRRYGPKPSGPTGSVDFPVLVPPGVTKGQTRVVDAKGLTTTKAVDVRPAPPYRRWVVALAGRPRRGVAVELWAASADPKARAPRLSLRGPGDRAPRALRLKRLSSGLWRSSIRLPERAAAGRWRLELLGVGGRARVARTFTLGQLVASRPASRPATRPATLPASPASRPVMPSGSRLAALRATFSLAGGLSHDTGELVFPRIAAAAGLDLPLGEGRLGLDLELAALWRTDDAQLAAGATNTRTDVLLLPLSLLLRYEVSLGRWAPLVAVGPTLTIARVEQRGEAASGETRRSSAVVGFVGTLGLRWRLGPGGLIATVGYQHAHVETSKITLDGIGLFGQLGYRLELGGR